MGSGPTGLCTNGAAERRGWRRDDARVRGRGGWAPRTGRSHRGGELERRRSRGRERGGKNPERNEQQGGRGELGDGWRGGGLVKGQLRRGRRGESVGGAALAENPGGGASGGAGRWTGGEGVGGREGTVGVEAGRGLLAAGEWRRSTRAAAMAASSVKEEEERAEGPARAGGEARSQA